MPENSGSKGNPAHVRMSNAARKTRRSLSWQRAQRRHEQNRKDAVKREKDNALALLSVLPSQMPHGMGEATGSHRGNGNPSRPSKVLRYVRRAEKQRAYTGERG